MFIYCIPGSESVHIDRFSITIIACALASIGTSGQSDTFQAEVQRLPLYISYQNFADGDHFKRTILAICVNPSSRKYQISKEERWYFYQLKKFRDLIWPVFHKMPLKIPEVTGCNKWNQVTWFPLTRSCDCQHNFVVDKKIKSPGMDCMSRNTFCFQVPLIDCIGTISYKAF